MWQGRTYRLKLGVTGAGLAGFPKLPNRVIYLTLRLDTEIRGETGALVVSGLR